MTTSEAFAWTISAPDLVILFPLISTSCPLMGAMQRWHHQAMPRLALNRCNHNSMFDGAKLTNSFCIRSASPQKHGIAAREHYVTIQVLADIKVAYHDGVEDLLMDTVTLPDLVAPLFGLFLRAAESFGNTAAGSTSTTHSIRQCSVFE
jgi:hypothetical protein